MDIRIDYSEKRKDDRGFLVDFIKGSEMENEDKKLGQIYFVTFDKKGVIRGNHFHKYVKEWFVVVKGRVKIILNDLKTGEKKEMIFNGNLNKYKRLCIGSNVLHTFICLSRKAAMINYSNKPYNNKDPDTHKLNSKLIVPSNLAGRQKSR